MWLVGAFCLPHTYAAAEGDSDACYGVRNQWFAPLPYSHALSIHDEMPPVQLGFIAETDNDTVDGNLPLTATLDDFPNKCGGKPVGSS